MEPTDDLVPRASRVVDVLHLDGPIRRRGSVAAYLLGLLAIATSTLIVELLGPLRLTNGAMLYLAAVLMVAVLLGRGPAIFTAVAASFVFDFFFVEPRFTLTVGNADEWLVLLTFVLVAVVVSELAALQRHRADEAEAREREALVLHDLGDLLGGGPFPVAAAAVAERVRAELGADAAAIELDGDALPGAVVVGDRETWEGASSAPFTVLGEQNLPVAGEAARPGHWIRVAPPRGAGPRGAAVVVRAPIRSGGRRIGQISLVNRTRRFSLAAADTRLLATAATQLALAADRERLRAEVTEAEVLRRANDLKSALLNAVSHDLRTPLAGIMASAGSLRQDDVEWSAEERAEFAENIENEAARLNRIVGNLLDLGRIEGGALRASRDWHDPALIVRDSVERIRSSVPTARIRLDVPDDLPPVLLDPVEVDQVVTNLLENAVRHSPPGTEVTLSVRVDDEGLRVSVDDLGPGIAPAALPRIFEPFYRAPGDSGSPGSGVGLAVARGLVAAHDGRIWAENRPRGARFTFVIPSPPAPRPAEA